MKKYFTLSLFLAVTTLTAQETIDVQRPTLTESSSIIEKGFIQFENGVQLSESIPSYAVFSRFGVSKRLELRVFSDLKNPYLDISGKVLFFESKGVRPGMSLTVNYNLKAGATESRLCITNSIGKTPLFYTINGVYKNYEINGIALLGLGIGDKLAIFAEYQMDATQYQQINGGITFLPSKELQLDVHAGLTDMEDYYVGAGFAFRLK